MYLNYFGMKELPFSITPDTGYFFSCSSHQEALNTLIVAIESGEGFIKITGEVGTGKTLLCRKFIKILDEINATTAYIPNPYVGPMTLLFGVADELGIQYSERINQHQILKMLTEFLLARAAAGERVVLCLDEAQALPVETMEALRLLSNLETERRKLLQVVLFGQPELNDKLANPAIRQLRQRIAFSYNLMPMTREDVSYYLTHRLMKAGYQGRPLFSQEASVLMHKLTGGIPRLVNILAHKSLLAVRGEGMQLVQARHVVSAYDDTDSFTMGKPTRLESLWASAGTWFRKAML